MEVFALNSLVIGESVKRIRIILELCEDRSTMFWISTVPG